MTHRELATSSKAFGVQGLLLVCRQSGSYNVAARIEMPNITKTFHYNLRTLSLGLSFGGSEDL